MCNQPSEWQCSWSPLNMHTCWVAFHTVLSLFLKQSLHDSIWHYTRISVSIQLVSRLLVRVKWFIYIVSTLLKAISHCKTKCFTVSKLCWLAYFPEEINVLGKYLLIGYISKLHNMPLAIIHSGQLYLCSIVL